MDSVTWREVLDAAVKAPDPERVAEAFHQFYGRTMGVGNHTGTRDEFVWAAGVPFHITKDGMVREGHWSWA